MDQLWRTQFYSPPTVAITRELTFFLATLADAIKSQPALKPFTDSRAFEQLYLIAERADRQIDEQRITNEHLQAIHHLLADMAHHRSSASTQVQIQSEGGAVLQGNANAGQDVVLRDKVTNVYHLYHQPTSAMTAEPATTPNLAQLVNPFTQRGRINVPQLFFGRQRILRELRQALASGNSIALIGAAETGKSSLLFHLHLTRSEWLPSHEVIYLDLQKVVDEKDFCDEILQKLTPLHNRELRSAADALRTLKRAFNERKVLLMLDEIERLTQRDFTPRLQGLLRALVQDGNLSLLVASEHPLYKLFPPSDPTSPLHNVFSSQDLPNFTSDEMAYFLHQRLATTGITFDDQELRELWATTQGHPGQVQRTAEALFSRKVGNR